jgi:hypothetical protein
MVNCVCITCGKEFGEYPSRIAAGRGKNCSKACANQSFKGQHFSPATEIKEGTMPWNFKGGTYTQSRKQSGKYILVYMPEHPFSTSSGHVREHRLVMERKLGRYLRPDEVVDHINMNTLDNRPENLRVMLKVEHDRMNVIFNVHKRWVERGGGHYAKQ